MTGRREPGRVPDLPDRPPPPSSAPAPPAASASPATAAPPPPGAPPPPSGEASRIQRIRASRAWRIGRWPLAGLALLGVAGTLLFAYLYATVELPDEAPQIRSSVVLDAQGRELAVLRKDEMRVEVDLEDVAPVVVEALLAAEDRNFRDHDGVDPRGLVRAVVNNLTGGDTQGGSTITQQLVKNAYLTDEQSYRRKAKEAILAIKLDRSEDKDEILERYLNTVYFGRGAYGIEAAARVYFETTAKDLTLPQAALLIGLLRAPESADPNTDPEAATTRRNGVIDDLVDVEELTAEEAKAFKATELGATDELAAVELRAGVGAHVVEWIRQEAVERFGAEAVYGGGLTIETTIDIDHQRAAEAAVAQVLDQPDDPQAALVNVDPFGRVTAHVGGRSYDELQVDLARGTAGGGTGRQAGSAFKPVVLAAALEDRTATLGSTYTAPAEITLEPGGQPWTVGNYGGSGYGVVDLAEATTDSVNTTYAQLVLDTTPERAVEVAGALGVTSELRPDASIVLGTPEVSVLDVTSVYSTFARDGVRIDPFVIAKVTDADDAVLFEAQPEGRRAIGEGPARAVTHALRGVVEEGTGTGAAFGRPAAGKTGTTQSNGDAWFAGYTPAYTAAVWMGYPEGPDRPMDDVHGQAITGGSLPADIWRTFMTWIHEGVDPTDFPEPPDDLLEPPELEQGTLSVSPTSGPGGTVITASGEGFDPCIVSWYVELDPSGASSAPDQGSNASGRSATITVPDGLGSGDARVIAWCDRGNGPEIVGQAPFAVQRDPKEVEEERMEEEKEEKEEEEEAGDTTTTTTAPDQILEVDPGKPKKDG